MLRVDAYVDKFILPCVFSFFMSKIQYLFNYSDNTHVTNDLPYKFNLQQIYLINYLISLKGILSSDCFDSYISNTNFTSFFADYLFQSIKPRDLYIYLFTRCIFFTLRCYGLSYTAEWSAFDLTLY